MLTLGYHVTGIINLTLTLRYYVALSDQLDVTLCCMLPLELQLFQRKLECYTVVILRRSNIHVLERRGEATLCY